MGNWINISPTGDKTPPFGPNWVGAEQRRCVDLGHGELTLSANGAIFQGAQVRAVLD